MNVPILDTHQHLIYPDRWPYSWTRDLPALANKPFHYEDYLEAARDTGIAATVFMESTPDDPHWQEEAPFVHELSRQPGSLIRGIIANCRPEDAEGFVPYVEQLRERLGNRLVGLRRFLHAVPDDTSEPPHFAANLRRLAGWNLTFDLCVFARQLPIAIRLARACPEVQFILDHCGVPDIAGGGLDPWRSHISELARLPNVACKISGVLAYCRPDQAKLETVRPYVEHCLEAFGWGRVVWGSDWPVVTLTSTLRDWVAVSRAIVANESEEHQRALFHENACRIYRVNWQPTA